jgi:hypothetical protein
MERGPSPPKRVAIEFPTQIMRSLMELVLLAQRVLH